MASGPITSWKIGGEIMETVRDFIFLGSQITADSDCSHEIKTLSPWKKNYDKPRECIKKQRHTMPTKVHLVKAMIFPVVIYGCESWTLSCWRKLLRVPWTTRRSNQSILKGISPQHSLEGLMLKLKLQYSGHLMRRTDSLEKTLMLGKIEGRRRRGRQRMTSLDGITNSMDMSLSMGLGNGQGSLVYCSPRSCKESDTTE